jgi:pyruvate/2-oxoglutarate dehydrogenase complex dihydrolipoamide acyltransferase (E2) component
MAVQVLMPSLGVGHGTGRVVRWMKREGQLVEAGEPLLEVETEKAVVQVDSPGSGVLNGVRVREGEEARVGTVIAYLLAPAARPPERLDELADEEPAPERRTAGAPAAPVPAAPEPPSFLLLRDVDASQLIVARSRWPAAVTGADLLLRLVAVTLARHPAVNSGSRDVDVALTVAAGDRVVTPVVAGADRLDVAALAARRAELVTGAATGRLRVDDFRGATFTVSDLGAQGVDAVLPLAMEGRSAILGVGRIADRVVPVAGAPQVRPVLSLALACDRRRVGGPQAARFLSDLAAAVEEPAHWT